MRIIKEPLLHFLLLGLAIFIFYGLITDGAESSNEKIIIDDSDIERLIQNYQKTWSETPDDKTLKTLVDDYVRSEVLYKEALQLNLDHNDEIIKRRLMQKYDFLIEDLASSGEVEDNELKKYWEENTDRYLSPKLLSFKHHYFNPDKVDDAEALAKSNLKLVPSIEIRSHSSHLDKAYSKLELSKVANIFGQEFSNQIDDLTPEIWHGPIKSGYGFHLVFITEIDSSQTRSFEEVKDIVNRDYKEQFVDEQRDELYKVLVDKFDVDYQLQKYKEIYQ